jgi:hypothetical protein
MTRCRAAVALSALLMLTMAGVRPAVARTTDVPLTLRINRAIAEPGGVFAVVLRTYAARPIRQGQVSIRIASPTTTAAAAPVRRVSTRSGSGSSTQTPPVATLLSAVVFSVNGDTQTRTSAILDSTGWGAVTQFQSLSAGINAADGPLAVFFFQLDPGVAPGQKLTLQIDPKVTSLLDANGRQITLDPRGGTLEVQAPGSPRTLGADGGTATAGGLATLAMQTFEPFLLSQGQLALRFDPSLVVGDPVVRIDPRYGRADFTVDRSTPGLLVVSFTSPDASLNTVPGSIVAIDVTIAPGATAGTVSPLAIDPALSWLIDAQGKAVDLVLEAGTLTIQ